MAVVRSRWRCPINYDAREQAILLSLFGDKARTNLGGATYLLEDGLVCFVSLAAPNAHHVTKLAQLREGLQPFAKEGRVMVALDALLTRRSDVVLALATVGSVFQHAQTKVQETQYQDESVSFSVSMDRTRAPKHSKCCERASLYGNQLQLAIYHDDEAF